MRVIWAMALDIDSFLQKANEYEKSKGLRRDCG